MGYVSAMGNCAACGRLFQFNPVHVPSIRVAGVREPVCRPCIDKVNRNRADQGFALIAFHPDAYDACDESEL